MSHSLCILCFTGVLLGTGLALKAETPHDTKKVRQDHNCSCTSSSIWNFTWSEDEVEEKPQASPSQSVAEGFSRGSLRPFLELSSKLSNPGDEPLHMRGLRLGLSEKRQRVLALAYYTTAGELSLRPGISYELRYGGLVFGGMPELRSITEGYLSLLLGTGQATIHTQGESRTSRPLFIIEPELGFAINLNSWWQLAAGVSYRYMNGLEVMGVDSHDLRGLTANLHIRFHGLGAQD